jgi:uncharacterized protein YcbK (DUF882 family)
MLTEQQRDDIGTMKFLNIIDEQIRVIAEFAPKQPADASSPVDTYVLVLYVFHKDEPITRLTFDLRGYDYEELQDMARNIRDNEFIMYELDLALSGHQE